MFSSTRAKWLSIVLLILVGASISGSLFANETNFFYKPTETGLFSIFGSIESTLWLMGSALLGLAGMRRFGC